MSLQCQKIEIKKLPFYASDITNFTSAVCAVVTEMSTIGEPIFESWAATYSGDLYDTFTTVNTYSSIWQQTDDYNVNTFVYSNSANILQVDSAVNTNSGNWNSIYNSYNSSSAGFLTNSSADIRYVKLSGDVMTGGLSSPSLSTNNLYVAGSTINFFDESGSIIETLKSNDVGNFKSNYTLTNSRSAKWEETYSNFSSQSGNNSSVYNTVQTNSGSWNYQGTDIKALTSNWENTYNNFSLQSSNNLSVYNNVNSNSGNWNYSYHTILTGGTIGGNVSVSGNLSAWTADINYIDFNSTVDNPPYQEGRLFYDNNDNTLSLYVDNPNVTLNLGQEMWVLGVNKTGSIIPNGTVVYLSGAQGNRPKMWPALANNDLGSADTIGVTTHTVAINQEGYITTEGIVSNIDTSSFKEGEVLYLSPTISGGITDVKPVAPQHLVKIGYALNTTNNGKIFVTIDNGYELDELHNVRITNAQNNQIISYNSTSSIWVNTSAYNGSDIKSLTGNWENTYTNFSLQSANNLSVYNNVYTNSAYWQATTGGGGGGIIYYFNQATLAQSPTTNIPITAHQLGRSGLSAQTIYTSSTLSQVSYSLIAGFLTDVLDPNTTVIPAGVWDFNIWGYSNANVNNPTVMQALVYKYDGINAPVLISTSDDTTLTDSGVFIQHAMSCLISQTPISLTDRIYVEFRAKASAGLKTVTLAFGDATPSHLHTTLPSVGGTGLVKVIDGVLQSPASLLVDADVASGANISQSKINGLTDIVNKANSTYNTVNVNSATNWNYQGTDIKALTANWENTYSTVQSNSASWLQSISFNENTAQLSISNSNTVSLSALSGGVVSPPDPIPLISSIWS